MIVCPMCNKGTLKKGMIKETMFGIYLGDFHADICSSCGESFTNQQTTHDIQDAAKKKGLWGLGIKTKVTRSGNSLAIRIPAKIASFLKIKEGEETYIHPENNKIIIEPL